MSRRSIIVMFGALLSSIAALLATGCYSTTTPEKSVNTPEDLPQVSSVFLNGLDWRSIGPYRGGRASAVAGDPRNPLVFYFGASHGGVWKTDDAGTYWRNVSDGFFNSGPVGAIAVSESEPNVIYVGTGESCPRPDVAPGDGVYKSIDGGKSWTHVGLKETRHIAKIRIHPKNPNVVYVAAMGDLFGSNPERGVYRTKDGGNSWERVLFKSERAGAVDISMDATNPNVLYASIYQYLRQPWDAISGGPDSGLYKSTDGGDSWTDLSGNPGLPKGIKGKIGVAVSPARSSRVWALIEAEDGALFCSDDGGKTWQRINDQRDLRRSAHSYMHVTPHPQDANTLYIQSYDFWKSTDAGATFTSLPMPHGDHHALWIDPHDPRRMIEGSDGGAVVTLNGGASWSGLYNQPTAAIFHLTVDTQFPYRVYGTQNDNSAISVPSRTGEGAIPWKESYPVGGAESGHIVVRPDDPNIVIVGSIGSSPGGGGNLLRYDHRTGQARLITVWPEVQYGSPVKDLKYRFQFTYPVVLSPHDPNVLYVAANRLFRSVDQGTSWDVISPDLTRNDVSKMQVIIGGPITTMGGSASEVTSVIYALAESPLTRGEMWAGTDEGLIKLSRDGGETWEDVSPKDLPEWTCISILEVSRHRSGTVYFAAHRYKLGDHRVFLYKTTDYGRTWQKITSGIRENDFAWVIREDPVRPGLLYAGTETGVYASFDAGASWQSLRGNLPAVPVHDLVVKDSDLIIASHGRGFWILDNVTPLRQITPQVTQASAHLFEIPPTFRLLPVQHLPPMRNFRPGIQYQRTAGDVVAYEDHRDGDGRVRRTYLNAGQDRPGGVMIDYYLKETARELALAIMDDKGELISQFSSQAKDSKWLPARAGLNRFVWDMRYLNARELAPDLALSASEDPRAEAPVAPPGRYRARLTAGGQIFEQSFEIRKDPRVSATEADLEAQFKLMVQIRDRLSEVTDAVTRLRETRREVEEEERQAGGQAELTRAAARVKQKLRAIEGNLTVLVGPNPMNLPPQPLNNKLAALTLVVQSADTAPTRQSYAVFEELSARVTEQLRQLDQVTKDVAAIAKRSRAVRAKPRPADRESARLINERDQHTTESAGRVCSMSAGNERRSRANRFVLAAVAWTRLEVALRLRQLSPGGGTGRPVEIDRLWTDKENQFDCRLAPASNASECVATRLRFEVRLRNLPATEMVSVIVRSLIARIVRLPQRSHRMPPVEPLS